MSAMGIGRRTCPLREGAFWVTGIVWRTCHSLRAGQIVGAEHQKDSDWLIYLSLPKDTPLRLLSDIRDSDWRADPVVRRGPLGDSA